MTRRAQGHWGCGMCGDEWHGSATAARKHSASGTVLQLLHANTVRGCATVTDPICPSLSLARARRGTRCTTRSAGQPSRPRSPSSSAARSPPPPFPVSYTHLRAHETEADL
eukprot:28835-Rhodomonas_salina.1